MAKKQIKKVKPKSKAKPKQKSQTTTFTVILKRKGEKVSGEVESKDGMASPHDLQTLVEASFHAYVQHCQKVGVIPRLMLL